MNKKSTFAGCVLAVASWLTAAELTSYAVGGGGGLVRVGKQTTGVVVGQPLAAVTSVGEQTLRAGYWIEVASVETGSSSSSGSGDVGGSSGSSGGGDIGGSSSSSASGDIGGGSSSDGGGNTYALAPKTASAIGVRLDGRQAELSFEFAKAQMARVRVLGADGRLLSTLWEQKLNAGLTVRLVNLGALPAGASFIVIEAGSALKTLRFVSAP